ncbi:MAG: hypothetical protein SFY81_04095 [Verrucomicrobiota bacterium]|nr:hypothetical protein [Verrucomicrobiota bacterium]
MTMKSLLPLSLALMLLTGCTATITNLTPRQTTRNANNLYPFEVAWETRQGTLKKETIKPYVVIGMEQYPMQPAPSVPDRWEAIIPIPADQQFINYRYKFDYMYKAIPKPESGSQMSQPYQLEIRGK